MPTRMGKMIAICGAKGGTGATTLTIQLALRAVADKQQVCIVDLDLQKGDVPSYLDITHRRSIADLMATAAELDGVILGEALYVHRDGPHVLLAPPDGELAEDVSARAARQILGGLRAGTTSCSSTAATYMTEANAIAIELADNVLVTVTPDLPCLRAAQRLGKMWERLQIRKRDDMSVVLVRADRKNEVQPDFARKILGLPDAQDDRPGRLPRLEEATNTGAPKTVENGDYRKAVIAVAREVGLVAATASPAARARGKGDAGVAITEFVVLIPFIGLILLLIWQAILVGLTSMYSSHAADEGARAVAVLGYDVRGAGGGRNAGRSPGSPDQWGDKNHFHLSVDGDYVKVTIDTPAVLPGMQAPWGISTKAKIVYEDGGDMP